MQGTITTTFAIERLRDCWQLKGSRESTVADNPVINPTDEEKPQSRSAYVYDRPTALFNVKATPPQRIFACAFVNTDSGS